jgi:hypothetical protein
MAYKKRAVPVTTMTGAATPTVQVGLGAYFGRIVGFRASKTGDAATRIQIADADSRIVYLDAADVDYTTVKDRVIQYDDTVSGLTWTLVDATGAAATAADAGHAGPVVKSPLTLTFSNCTAADIWTVFIYVEV